MRRWKDGYVGGRNSGSGCTGGGRISGVRLRHRPDREGRIKAHALPDQPPMQVRACGAAGRAELADDLATPASAALIGVPAGAVMSTPRCGWRGWRLRIVLLPKTPVMVPVTGHSSGVSKATL